MKEELSENLENLNQLVVDARICLADNHAVMVTIEKMIPHINSMLTIRANYIANLKKPKIKEA